MIQHRETEELDIGIDVGFKSETPENSGEPIQAEKSPARSPFRRWILGAVFLLLVGLTLQLGLLVFAMYVLLGVMVVSRYMAREWTDNLTATRECNRVSVQIDEKVAVIVNISNNGRMRIPWLLIEDSLPKDALTQRPPRIQVKGKRLQLATLGADETKSLLYQVTFLMRGYYQIGPLLLESGDLFGLHRRYRVVTEPQFVLVYPRVVPLQGYDIASRRPIGEIRLMHRLFEDPTRISGVREYQNGDPFNRIHWKSTARTGVLHSKVYEASTIVGATILLDFHRDVYSAQGEPFRSELAVTAAASLANAVYQLGQQVGFITNGRDAVDRIRTEGWRHEFRTRTAARENVGMRDKNDRLQPVVVETRRGADQFMRIQEALARVELTDGLSFAQLVLETSSRMPRDASIIAVLPHVSLETAVTLGTLKRSGYAVTAVLTMYNDEEDYATSAGRLLAEGIDVRQVEDEIMLAAVCSEQLLR
jgi:uncharacterized protein (DUF58 family)